MKSEIEKVVEVLVGSSLWVCRCTADLASFQFGPRVLAKTFKGKPVEVGKYALNIQCAWRISRSDRVVVGHADRFYPSDLGIERAPSGFDWSRDPNRRDEILRVLFADGSRQFPVRGVDVGAAGSLHIKMDEELALDVLPDDSLSHEHWRFFKPNGSEKHFVFTGKGIEALRED